jgi:hypothetical protein
MKANWGWSVSCAGLCVVFLAGVCGERCWGSSSSDSGVFTDSERVARFLDNSPDAAVRLLEGVLSREQGATLEKAMFPEASMDEKRQAYKEIDMALSRIGVNADDSLRKGVAERIESLASESNKEEER